MITACQQGSVTVVAGAAGRLDARARINAVTDQGSFHEIGELSGFAGYGPDGTLQNGGSRNYQSDATGTNWTGGKWMGASWSGGDSSGTWSGGSWRDGSWTGGSWRGGSWAGGSWSGGSWR